jgi:hypothetical protein
MYVSFCIATVYTASVYMSKFSSILRCGSFFALRGAMAEARGR